MQNNFAKGASHTGNLKLWQSIVTGKDKTYLTSQY